MIKIFEQYVDDYAACFLMLAGVILLETGMIIGVLAEVYLL